ncbi:MAG: ABC transporter permease [Candidatus Marinimicrobia bacterium]|nr:ABC transporter permease [Candidatus Neomarinimicrobiota bacterium]
MLKNILQVLRELKKQKLRTFLTLFGIIWGTVSVILLLAFGFAIKAQTSESMHGLGESICIMWSGKTSISYAGFPRGRNLHFQKGDAEFLRDQVPLIGNISPQYSRSVAVRVKDKKQSFNINAVLPEFTKMRNLVPRMGGRFLNQLDEKKRRRVVFIGFDVEEKMFGKGNGLGKTIYIEGMPFTVIGVLIQKKQDSSYNGRDKDAIYMPVSTYLGIYGDRYMDNMVCKAENVEYTDQMKDDIQLAYARKYRFHPDDTEALGIWDTTENEKFLNTFFGGFNIFLGVVGVMTLIVGGIGISNIMYVIVEERTNEIGIKRAVGAKKHLILFQYLTETFVIAGLGTIIGFLISMGIIALTNQLPLKEYIGTLVLDPVIAMTTIIIIVMITLAAGWGPATRASNLDPVIAINK